jgi:hypothetical protein
MSRKDAPEHVVESDEDDKEAEAIGRRRAGSAVQTIRDVPDQYVFRFEVGPAILAQLLKKLETIPLSSVTNALDGKYPGFYQLFHKRQPVYIGKTARPIGDRLREHAKKLRDREGIDLAEVECRYAFVEDPSLVDVAEGALISFFGERGLAEWNQTGFGSKVTGHGRGGQAASKWAGKFLPKLDLPIEAGSDSPISVHTLHGQIRKKAPLTFSVPTAFRAAFLKQHSKKTSIPRAVRPFREWVDDLESRLARGWEVERTAMSWYITKKKKT